MFDARGWSEFIETKRSHLRGHRPHLVTKTRCALIFAILAAAGPAYSLNSNSSSAGTEASILHIVSPRKDADTQRRQVERLVARAEALEEHGDYGAIAHDLEDLQKTNDLTEELRDEALYKIGTVFWERANAAKAKNDRDRYIGDAKATVLALRPFWAKAQEREMPSRHRRDELAMLAEAYMMLNEPDSAFDVYTFMFSSDRRDAGAAIGKAKAAEALKRDDSALEAWLQVQTVLTPRDPQWFEARYKIAKINADRGHVADACDLLTRTETNHPDLGTSDIKNKWQSLQHRLVCP